jgi:hypothetical protein
MTAKCQSKIIMKIVPMGYGQVGMDNSSLTFSFEEDLLRVIRKEFMAILGHQDGFAKDDTSLIDHLEIWNQVEHHPGLKRCGVSFLDALCASFSPVWGKTDPN